MAAWGVPGRHRVTSTDALTCEAEVVEVRELEPLASSVRESAG
jgi:hypothetical protein